MAVEGLYTGSLMVGIDRCVRRQGPWTLNHKGEDHLRFVPKVNSPNQLPQTGRAITSTGDKRILLEHQPQRRQRPPDAQGPAVPVKVNLERRCARTALLPRGRLRDLRERPASAADQRAKLRACKTCDIRIPADIVWVTPEGAAPQTITTCDHEKIRRVLHVYTARAATAPAAMHLSAQRGRFVLHAFSTLNSGGF